MRLRLLAIIAFLANGALADTVAPVGAEAVESLLKVCSDARAIVANADSKPGTAKRDPKLGIPNFVVPSEMKLSETLRANHSIMSDEKSRRALIGCAKMAGKEFAPGWVVLLRAVGRDQGDSVCVKISYNIAAYHELPLGNATGLADLKTLINEAIETNAVEYHPAQRTNRLASLTIRDEGKFNSLLESHRNILGPELIGAAADSSHTKCDHAPVLKAIAQITNDLAAAAFGAELAARRYEDELKPLKAAEQLELAATRFAQLYDMPSRARVLTQLGEVRKEMGEDERALEHFNEAYNSLNLVYEGKHRRLADLRRLKAELYCDRNEIQRSLSEYVKAIAIFMAMPDSIEHFDDVVKMMRLMARINIELGHTEEARENLTDCLTLLAAVDAKFPFADTNPSRAFTLRELGLLELRCSRFDAAMDGLDRALNIQMRREGAVHPETIKTLFALGQVCAARHELGMSEFFTREAIIFLTHLYGSKHPALIAAWSNRAAIHSALGRYRQSADDIASGLDAARISNKNDSVTAEDYLPARDTVQLLARRGDLSLRAVDDANEPTHQLKRLQQARDDYQLAEGIFNRIRRNMPGDEDRLLADDVAPDFFIGQLRCNFRLHKIASSASDHDSAFGIVERATARSLLDTLGDDVASSLAGLPEDLRVQHLKLRMQLDETLREYNQIPFHEGQTSQSPAQVVAWEKFVQTQKDLQQFEHTLAGKFPVPSRENGVAICTAEQAASLLKENEVAIAFLMGAQESFAVVLSRGTNGPEINVHLLPPRSKIEDKVVTLIEPAVMDQSMGEQLGDDLYDQLLGPLTQSISGKDLLIVPTGLLCRLPFELLRTPANGSRQYLGLTCRIRYAPSLTILHLLQERQRTRRANPDLPVWAMANPRQPTLPLLPRATIEARTIGSLLKADAGSVRVEQDATKAALLAASSKGLLKRYRFLHFAVHSGFASEINPTPGLVLGGDTIDNGFLDMNDIAHLDVNSDLVVLSACSSGGGRIYNGEGIRGLTSSFLAAGARAVIATQWPLADVGAASFMESFYRRIQAGKTPVDALWETRREAALGPNSRPPSEWAAFILEGN